MFIAMHHNVTSTVQDLNEYGVPIEVLRYTYGVRDACAVFFYFLICIVMHAIIQEYILDVSAVGFVSWFCAKFWSLFCLRNSARSCICPSPSRASSTSQDSCWRSTSSLSSGLETSCSGEEQYFF
jgi:TRAM1-like protein